MEISEIPIYFTLLRMRVARFDEKGAVGGVVGHAGIPRVNAHPDLILRDCVVHVATLSKIDK